LNGALDSDRCNAFCNPEIIFSISITADCKSFAFSALNYKVFVLSLFAFPTRAQIRAQYLKSGKISARSSAGAFRNI